MTIDIQEEDERIKRFIFERDGERIEIAHRVGTDTATLTYTGFSGSSAMQFPVAGIPTGIEVLTRLQAFLTPLPEESPEEPAPPTEEPPIEQETP